tara:strand:- start:7444 stop:8739 length:1296 start_codon:yes stop_codon:yes gene_type:complete
MQASSAAFFCGDGKCPRKLTLVTFEEFDHNHAKNYDFLSHFKKDFTTKSLIIQNCLMELKNTPLHSLCKENGCKFASFAGWNMPIQFEGLIKEHEAVRNSVGIFDISHMGVFQLTGKKVRNELQKLFPSDLERIAIGEACYTVILNEDAGIIDDVIIYDLGLLNDDKENFMMIINASRIEKDLEWLRTYLLNSNIVIQDTKKDGVLLALQGPNAEKILSRKTNFNLSSLPTFAHRQLHLKLANGMEANNIFISRTGYTGEDGFEILLPDTFGKEFWQELLNEGVTPCGLGSRDTLRLEAGMHLYGKDLSISTTPFEAGLGWLVHLEKNNNFHGRQTLEKQARDGIQKKLVCLAILEKGIARSEHEVFYGDFCIGKITSGSWSPTLKKAIAMAYVNKDYSKPGTKLTVSVRGKKILAQVVKKPFYRKTAKSQ